MAAAERAASVSDEPQLLQNLLPAATLAPHVGHDAWSGEPHSRQNRAAASFSVPHAEQRIGAEYMTGAQDRRSLPNFNHARFRRSGGRFAGSFGPKSAGSAAYGRCG